jgi:hypothetical protein
VLFILEVFMKNLVLALALAVGSFAVQAESYETYGVAGGTEYNTDGSTVQRIGSTSYRTDRDGNRSNYESYGSGNIKYNTDGSMETKIGGTTYRDESVSSKWGSRR